MHNCLQMYVRPQGGQAARLRQRKYALLRKFPLPDDLLPGALTLTHRRCGKPTCHCARGEGHPIWFLTFMAHGKRHVEWVPREWVKEIGRRVEGGRELLDAVREVLAINAQLLVLWRKQKGK